MSSLSSAWKKDRIATIFLVVGLLAFTTLLCANLLRDFEQSDDILLLDRAQHQTVSEIFTTSFLTDKHTFFYRPLATLLTKVLVTDTLSPIPYRVTQLLLGLACMGLLLGYFYKKKVPLMGLAALSILLGATPFLYATFTWWVDVTSLLSLFFFLIALHLLAAKRIPLFASLCVMACALLSKELGLVTSLLFCYQFFRQKRFDALGATILLVACYFALRHNALGAALPSSAHALDTSPGPVPFRGYDSGFIVPYESREQMYAIFGDFPYPYYLYNVVAQTLTLFFWQPVEGVIRFMPLRHVLITLLQVASSLVIFTAWKKKRLTIPLLFIFVILLNAFISYRYANMRHLPLSAVIWVLLAAQAMGGVWSMNRFKWVVPVILVGWLSYQALITADLVHFAQIEDSVYQEQESQGHEYPFFDPDIYQKIRERHLQEWLEP